MRTVFGCQGTTRSPASWPNISCMRRESTLSRLARLSATFRRFDALGLQPFVGNVVCPS